MKSVNFEIIRDGWPELAALGGFAVGRAQNRFKMAMHFAYTHADPASAVVKLRLFAENLTKDIYRDLRLPKPEQPTLVDLLKNAGAPADSKPINAFAAITPKGLFEAFSRATTIRSASSDVVVRKRSPSDH